MRYGLIFLYLWVGRIAYDLRPPPQDLQPPPEDLVVVVRNVGCGAAPRGACWFMTVCILLRAVDAVVVVGAGYLTRDLMTCMVISKFIFDIDNLNLYR